MRLLVQRVDSASVSIDSNIVGQIEKGLLVLVGFQKEDSQTQVDSLINKLLEFNFFEDENGRFGKTIKEVHGSVLAVSQFTLYGRCQKGRKPDFSQALEPRKANELYDLFVKQLKDAGVQVETGEFGAYMKVESVNDGPVTFLIEK